jgi:hypothetical protein
MRRKYPSDITREAYGKIEEQLLAATKGTRPRSYDLYDGCILRSPVRVEGRMYVEGAGAR